MADSDAPKPKPKTQKPKPKTPKNTNQKKHRKPDHVVGKIAISRVMKRLDKDKMQSKLTVFALQGILKTLLSKITTNLSQRSCTRRRKTTINKNGKETSGIQSVTTTVTSKVAFVACYNALLETVGDPELVEMLVDDIIEAVNGDKYNNFKPKKQTKQTKQKQQKLPRLKDREGILMSKHALKRDCLCNMRISTKGFYIIDATLKVFAELVIKDSNDKMDASIDAKYGKGTPANEKAKEQAVTRRIAVATLLFAYNSIKRGLDVRRSAVVMPSVRRNAAKCKEREEKLQERGVTFSFCPRLPQTKEEKKRKMLVKQKKAKAVKKARAQKPKAKQQRKTRSSSSTKTVPKGDQNVGIDE